MVARSIIILALGALASAQNFEGFPESITCKQSSGGNASVSKAEIEAAVAGPVGPKGTLEDNSASDVASGSCSTLHGIPLYSVGVENKATVGFAYDKANNTYHFCFSQGAVDATGFPSACST